MQLIVIKIDDLNQNPEFALLGNKQTQGRYSSSDWNTIRTQSRGRKVVLLLGNNDVVLTTVEIPSKNRKQLLQAVPFALEDTLADDIENLHFAVFQDTTKESNESYVAIINRELLIERIDLLKSHGIVANFVLPEILTQKTETNAWSIDYKENKDEVLASVRTSKFTGFACDKDMLDMFVTEPFEKLSPKTIFSNTKKENLPSSLANLNYNYIESDTLDYNSTLVALSLNLLNNFVRRNQQASPINWKAWRPATVLGGLLASIWMGIFFWQNNQLQSQSNQLKTQIEQVYKSTFPQGRIVDAPVQMTSALNKLKASIGQTIESPLPIIADMGPLLKEYKDMVLSELRYTENQLSMTIESPNLTRLDSFKKDAAVKSNLKVVIKDSTTTANKVKAVILISPLPRDTAKTIATTPIKREES